MITLSQCNPFVRVAMIQTSVMEGDRPRIPFDHRIFFVYEGNAVMILNGKEINTEKNSLIFLGIHDEYYFKGKIRAAVINFDMTMACCDKKRPICPVPRDRYDAALVFDRTEVDGLEAPVLPTADESLRRATRRSSR